MVKTAQMIPATPLTRVEVRSSAFGRSLIPYAALLLLIALFSILAPERFFTSTNALFILQQAAVVSIVAFGLTFVIMSGSIDLSVGSIMALAGFVAATTGQTAGPVAGVAAGLATGALCGALNGFACAVVKVPSFVVTLGMLSVARGTTLLLSGSRPVAIFDSFEGLGARPGILIVVAVAFAIAFVLHRYTAFGRYVLAIGGEERVAALSGVAIERIKMLVFITSGVAAGLGGIVLAARVGAATPTAATGFELSVIAAVVLGGTPLTGGTGSMVNTLVGGLVITILVNGMVILGVRPEVQLVIQGLVLVLAVLVSLDRRKLGAIK